MFIKNRLIAIRFLMTDKSVPLRKKLLVVFGIVYLFMPLDLIPAVLFPVAWMDDLLLWIYIIYNLKDYLDKYWLGEKTVNLEKNFKNKDIIDDVNFSVDEKAEKDIDLNNYKDDKDVNADSHFDK